MAWGLGEHESHESIHWGKEESTEPPRAPAGSEVNPALQVSEGQRVTGVVVNVAPFGLFVQIAPRLDGLLVFDHSRSPRRAREYQEGQLIRVVVMEIDLGRGRVILDLDPEEAKDPE